MVKASVLLLAFVQFIQVSGEYSSSEWFYPSQYSKTSCPDSYKQLESCVRGFEDCVGAENDVSGCARQICACTKMIKESASKREVPRCRDVSSKPCLLETSESKRSNIRESIMKNNRNDVIGKIRNRFDILRHSIEQFQNDCLYEAVKDGELVESRELKFILPLFVMNEPEQTEKCREAKYSLESSLKYWDSGTTKKLKFSYDFWALGTEYGPMGRVAMRLIAWESCGKRALDFNMDATVHVDCYDMGRLKEECDSAYFKSLEMHLSRMGAAKGKCRILVDFIKELFPTRSSKFYAEAQKYEPGGSKDEKVQKVVKGFSGFEDRSVTARDTKNNHFKLSAFEKWKYGKGGFSENVAIKCENRKNSVGVLALCGYTFGYCGENGQQNCNSSLSSCLQNTNGLTEPCRNAVVRLISSLNQFPLPSDTFEETEPPMLSDPSTSSKPTIRPLRMTSPEMTSSLLPTQKPRSPVQYPKLQFSTAAVKMSPSSDYQTIFLIIGIPILIVGAAAITYILWRFLRCRKTETTPVVGNPSSAVPLMEEARQVDEERESIVEQFEMDVVPVEQAEEEEEVEGMNDVLVIQNEEAEPEVPPIQIGFNDNNYNMEHDDTDWDINPHDVIPGE